jgi:hypothetical protein
VRQLPIPLLSLLAAATLTANLVVLDDAVAAATESQETPRAHDDVEGSTSTVDRDPHPAASDRRPRDRSVRADAARLQGRSDAWPVAPEVPEPAPEPTPDPEPEPESRAVAAAAGTTAEGAARDDEAADPRTAPLEPTAAADPPRPAPRTTPEPSPGPTPARATAGDDAGDCDHRCRGERLHRQLRIHEPPGWTVVFEDEHPAYLGLADSRTRTITLYLRASLPDRVLLWTLYHEVGHSHDFTFLNTAKRDRWSVARGYEGETWFGCNHCTDYQTPAGDWAEALASCHTGWDDQWRSELGAPPTAAQCELLHELRQP